MFEIKVLDQVLNTLKVEGTDFVPLLILTWHQPRAFVIKLNKYLLAGRHSFLIDAKHSIDGKSIRFILLISASRINKVICGYGIIKTKQENNITRFSDSFDISPYFSQQIEILYNTLRENAFVSLGFH